MKIAFTHNLKLYGTEDEAEFDTPETVHAIKEALISLGHEVDLVETSGPVSRTIARLEALSPDLIFNTAEGRFGKYREAFYPGIFEQLGIPYTGSDAFSCNLTLDKKMTKLVVSEANVPTPRSKLITRPKDVLELNLRLPVIIKPNYEGSSKGITQDSIAETMDELITKVSLGLTKYPTGILVEEYISGKDITVPFLELVSPKTKGVLSPIEYIFSDEILKSRRYPIYDYELKNSLSDHVSVGIPTDIPDHIIKRIKHYADTVFNVLNIKDLGRADFRITPNFDVYFIEINALPSLEPGAGIYLSAAQEGLTDIASVLDVVIKSAVKRFKISPRKKTRKIDTRHLRVGFTYNEKRVIPKDDPNTDWEAEYDSPKTLQAIRDAIASYGHDVIDLEANQELPTNLAVANVDFVFNISEGIKGLSRESQVPALLELMGIPYTGSDPACLTMTLDKSMAKRVVKEAGVLTPNFLVFLTGKEKVPTDFRFPCMVKPVAEGSSKGILSKSVAHNEKELREVAYEIITRYKQAAIAEEFLTGREFTVALLGEKRPKSLPPMEIVFKNPKNPYPIYAYQHKLDYNEEIGYDAPAKIDEKLRNELEKAAKKSFVALGCRDFGRIDLRLDRDGKVNFIECNPLPGLTPGWSDMCLIAQSAGIDYRTLIGEIMSPAIKRLKGLNKELFHPASANSNSEQGATNILQNIKEGEL